MGADDSQLAFGPLPVNRVDTHPGAGINKVDMPLAQAKLAIGRAVQKAITRSGASLKEFGDKAQVSRWCQGENPNLARLFQHEDARRQFVLALAEESGMKVEVTVRMSA